MNGPAAYTTKFIGDEGTRTWACLRAPLFYMSGINYDGSDPPVFTSDEAWSDSVGSAGYTHSFSPLLKAFAVYTNYNTVFESTEIGISTGGILIGVGSYFFIGPAPDYEWLYKFCLKIGGSGSYTEGGVPAFVSYRGVGGTEQGETDVAANGWDQHTVKDRLIGGIVNITFNGVNYDLEINDRTFKDFGPWAPGPLDAFAEVSVWGPYPTYTVNSVTLP